MVSAVDLGVNVVNLFIITQALRVDRYFEITGAPRYAEQLARANYWVNQIIEWVFMTIGAVIIFELCFETWRIVRARRDFRATTSSL
jgi:hypothetical protein